MRRSLQRAFDFVTSVVTPKVQERRLLLLTKKHGRSYVLETPEPVQIPKGKWTSVVVLATMRQALPLFGRMEITHGHRASKHFIDHHIEYDVVRIGFGTVLGLEEGDTPRAALERHGFRFVPIAKHRFADDIKQLFPDYK